MKIFTLFALFLALIVGCTDPKPVVKTPITETEITGAFGIKLGEVDNELITGFKSDWWLSKNKCWGVSCDNRPCLLGYEAEPNLSTHMFQKYRVIKHPTNSKITQIRGQSQYWHTNTPSGTTREYADQKKKYILDILEEKYGKPIKGTYGDDYDVKYVDKNLNVIKFESERIRNIYGDTYTLQRVSFADESLTADAHRVARELEIQKEKAEDLRRKNLIKNSTITDDF